MIEVTHLTKRYGAHDAVSDISFSVDKGGVTGFLGPNGAGKSTTMNIIAGCLGPTQGEVRVGGHDVLEQAVSARKLIGYLPEQPPLYADMTPKEYLNFVLSAKGVPKEKRRAQLREAMDRTQLHDVADRLIGNLSKGYRQRVGIAQALLGEPQVIILDEPTVGLDPKQIIEIRELIGSLGRERTVLLSSHILSEVQAVCDRILILSRGRLVADDTADHLERLLAGQTLFIEAHGTEQAARDALAGLEGVAESSFAPGEDGTTQIRVTPQNDADLREAIFLRFASAGVPLLEMRRERASLEEVFLELTGEQREAQASGRDDPADVANAQGDAGKAGDRA